ncbi:MAG: DNA gyrase inhibitor YacG [Acidobacteria bacterium]|nr:DNA gyrase inhibitor YacG [Acidobacteriota bacterium]
MKRTCPICKKPTDSETSSDFPFCSERCRLLDLGNWASEKYLVAEPAFEELAPEAPPGDNPFGENDRDN